MATQQPGTQDWSAQIGEQWRRRREAEEAARRASEIQQRAEAERRGSVYRGLLFAALVASRRLRRGFGIFCGVVFLLGVLLVLISSVVPEFALIGFLFAVIGMLAGAFWIGACIVSALTRVAVEDVRADYLD